MVDPALVGGAVAGVGVLTAAGYAYLSGDDASAGVDIDNDGDNEASYTFEGNDNNDHQAADGLDVGASADAPIEADSTDSAEVGAEAEDTNADVEEQADPTLEVVAEKKSVEDIKGIGPSRADDLADEGFDTPEDIYYASDENLEGVNGIGPHAVSQMREDIGSIGDEGNDGESSEESQADEDTASDTDDTTGEESSSNPDGQQDAESDGSDSQRQTDGSGSDSDEDASAEDEEAESDE